jgi:HAMP domain-containing protein
MDKDFTIFLFAVVVIFLLLVIALAVAMLAYATLRKMKDNAQTDNLRRDDLLMLTKRETEIGDLSREIGTVHKDLLSESKWADRYFRQWQVELKRANKLEAERDMLLKRVRVLELEHGDMQYQEMIP